jgi:sugar phosphate permease
LPASAATLTALLAGATFASLLARRRTPFVVASLLLATACVIAYWELGELYWIGVLPA